MFSNLTNITNEGYHAYVCDISHMYFSSTSCNNISLNDLNWSSFHNYLIWELTQRYIFHLFNANTCVIVKNNYLQIATSCLHVTSLLVSLSTVRLESLSGPVVFLSWEHEGWS